MLCLAIPLVGYAEDEDVFYRPSLNVPTQVHPKSFKRVDPKPIYISRSVPQTPSLEYGHSTFVCISEERRGDRGSSGELGFECRLLLEGLIRRFPEGEANDFARL